jgi:hypothetical protein
MNTDVKMTGHPPASDFGEAGRSAHRTDSSGGEPMATANEVMRPRVLRWSSVALLVSILFTSGYAAGKVVSGYRGKRDALVSFGRAVRDEAAAHHWRYEVLKTGDEGLLLYLEKTHFIEPQRAIAEWNHGNLDAVVAPAEMAPSLMRDFHDAALGGLRSGVGNDSGTHYVLIVH